VTRRSVRGRAGRLGTVRSRFEDHEHENGEQEQRREVVDDAGRRVVEECTQLGVRRRALGREPLRQLACPFRALAADAARWKRSATSSTSVARPGRRRCVVAQPRQRGVEQAARAHQAVDSGAATPT
jgi:hypothetical protein